MKNERSQATEKIENLVQKENELEKQLAGDKLNPNNSSIKLYYEICHSIKISLFENI